MYPGIKLATLPEMFDFVQCATDEPVLFNIESKINPDFANETRSPQDFVDIMGGVFASRGEAVLARITHQSFDVGAFPAHFCMTRSSVSSRAVARVEAVQAAIPHPSHLCALRRYHSCVPCSHRPTIRD